ncbi:response regulator [Thauera sp. AutoDN2]|uniref:response regulator n=1 Tax=Thauera sp. AutoDN2 TaxID=3416051 RepID=UPI003F4C0963
MSTLTRPEQAAPTAVETRRRTLLLVDDEENILAALKRALRRDRYDILTANSGAEGLARLAEQSVDVIVSDQRMPGMTGVEFLREARKAHPDTVRIVLSGYTELKSITDAINEGAIYKFLTKPWDDEQLRTNIAEAFKLRELAQENHRLTEALRVSNAELAAANARLEALLTTKEHELVIDNAALDVAREVLHAVPAGIIGVDTEGMIVFVNAHAERLLSANQPLLCSMAAEALPAPLQPLMRGTDPASTRLTLDGGAFRADCRAMGRHGAVRGHLIILLKE